LRHKRTPEAVEAYSLDSFGAVTVKNVRRSKSSGTSRLAKRAQ